jgi:hypothetical protein
VVEAIGQTAQTGAKHHAQPGGAALFRSSWSPRGDHDRSRRHGTGPRLTCTARLPPNGLHRSALEAFSGHGIDPAATIPALFPATACKPFAA